MGPIVQTYTEFSCGHCFIMGDELAPDGSCPVCWSKTHPDYHWARIIRLGPLEDE